MMNQLAIVVFSCISVFLFSTKHCFKWGFIFGLAGQPFWIYEFVKNHQWGMLVVALWFTFSHVKGVKNNFF
jgi:hypothetical protein